MTSPEQHSVKAASTYVVLAQTAAPGEASVGDRHIPAGLWKRLGEFTARNAHDAIRQAADGKTDTPVSGFVAVPARSWQPVKVTRKVETTLVIEDAS